MSGLFDAARMAAGPDAIRGLGPYQLRELGALPGFRVVPIFGHDRMSISFVSPSRSGLALLSRLPDGVQAAAAICGFL